MLKRKTNIFVTILFTFVAFMLIGTTNVNAATVTVMSEEELNSAIADTSTTEIKLGADIVLKDNLNICATPDLTLDLKGYTIDGETNSKTVYIYFGRNTSDEYTDCSLTIKDSSPNKTGTIKTSGYIYINSRFVKEKSVTITIEGGNFYTKTNGSFYLKPDGYMKNTKVNFFIKEGYFQNNFYVNGAGKLLRIGTDTHTIEDYDITLNIKFDKLTN